MIQLRQKSKEQFSAQAKVHCCERVGWVEQEVGFLILTAEYLCWAERQTWKLD